MTLLETAQKFLEHGFSWAAVIAAFIGWIKWDKERKRGRTQVHMAQEVHDIWQVVASKSGSNMQSPKDGARQNFSLLQAGLSRVTFAEGFTKHQINSFRLKRGTYMNKFKSRKFWMAVISAILVVANEGLDLGISSETVMTFAALIASFIFSEAYVDAKKKPEAFTVGDTGPAE